MNLLVLTRAATARQRPKRRTSVPHSAWLQLRRARLILERTAFANTQSRRWIPPIQRYFLSVVPPEAVFQERRQRAHLLADEATLRQLAVEEQVDHGGD